MVEQEELAQSAHEWIEGAGLVSTPQQEGRPSKKRRSVPSNKIVIKFDSNFGGFERTVSQHLSSGDLYRLAFRGRKARQTTFQLVRPEGNRAAISSPASITSLGFHDGEVIEIRIADQAPTRPRTCTAPSVWPLSRSITTMILWRSPIG